MRKSDQGQEVVLFVPLPHDLGQAGDGRSRVHRYRSLDLRLGRELRVFRAAHGLSQDEVASVVGAGGSAAISQWETGETVPEGVRRERLKDLLAGRLWPELRASMLGGEVFPRGWREAVRWYRRASRQVPLRRVWGEPIARELNRLRHIADLASLRECYLNTPSSRGVRGASSSEPGVHRRIEDAAYGLRRLEIAYGHQFDLGRSLVSSISFESLNNPPPQ